MLTETAVLPGGTRVLHSRGREVTTDTLLLGLWASPGPGACVCELGCGCGAASAVAAARHPGRRWLGLDVDPGQLRLARSNLLGTDDAEFGAVCCEAGRIPAVLPGGIADLVLMNPPYHPAGSGRPSPDEGREISRRGHSLVLPMFVRAAAHLLSDGGRLMAVLRPDAMPRLVRALGAWGLSTRRLQPVGRLDSVASLLLADAAFDEGSLDLLPQVDVPQLQRRLLDGA